MRAKFIFALVLVLVLALPLASCQKPPEYESRGIGITMINSLAVLKGATFAGAETHSGTESHVGTETHAGTETHSGDTTYTNLTATTITVTSLISQSVGFSASGPTELVSTTVTGPLTTTGATILNGGLTMDSTAFSVANTTGNTVISGTLKVTDTTNLVGALTLQGVAVSGPYRYGSATNVISGTGIAHGLATTPTIIFLYPTLTTSGITQTFYVLSSNATTITIGLSEPGEITTTTRLDWLAGK